MHRSIVILEHRLHMRRFLPLPFALPTWRRLWLYLSGRLRKLYALPMTCSINAPLAVTPRKSGGLKDTHCMNPEVRFGGEHDHASCLRMGALAAICSIEHAEPIGCHERAPPLVIVRNIPCKVDESLGEADLSEDPVARHSPLPPGVEEDMSLLLCVFVIV